MTDDVKALIATRAAKELRPGEIVNLGIGIPNLIPGFLEEGKPLLHEGYGKNYERLVEVKSKYDPANLFRLNANIEPST